jgi:cytochrome c-type biogenesis protein CcsB
VTNEAAATLSRVTFHVALGLYAAGMLAYFHHLAFRRDGVWRVASVLAWAGVLTHLVSVTARGVAAGRAPWGNMFEFSSVIALLVVATYLTLVERRYRVRTLGGFALGYAALSMAAAAAFFRTEPGPLVPALNSSWLLIHVAAAMLGSALFALGGVFSLLYLVQARRERLQSGTPDVAPARPPIMGGSIDAPPGLDADPSGDGDADVPSYVGGADEPVSAGSSPRGRGRLPASEVLDRLAYRTIAFAFPIWTFAVIAGAVWAEQAWGRYWAWDPKEVWAFITWVVFAGYLHARATAGWRGTKAAVVGVAGFASMLVSYYVVNFVLVGLHTYKGVG